MANRYSPTRMSPTTLVLLIVAIVAVVIIAAVQLFLMSGNNDTQTNVSQNAILDTSNDNAVRMTVRGAIVGDENYKSFQIYVSPTQRNLTVYKGYGNTVTDEIDLSNTKAAYEQFVYALDNAKFMDKSELTGEANDTRGVCATGRLYTFELLNQGDATKTLWTTSCSSTKGSLGTNLNTILNLFYAQIDGSKSMVGKI